MPLASGPVTSTAASGAFRADSDFRRGQPRAYHVHLVDEGGPLWRDYIAFRDYLRACRGRTPVRRPRGRPGRTLLPRSRGLHECQVVARPGDPPGGSVPTYRPGRSECGFAPVWWGGMWACWHPCRVSRAGRRWHRTRSSQRSTTQDVYHVTLADQAARGLFGTVASSRCPRARRCGSATRTDLPFQISSARVSPRRGTQ